MSDFLKGLLIGALLIVAAASCGSSFGKEYVLQKEYHHVERGDTIWGIAEHYYDKQNRYRNFNEFVHWVSKYNNYDGKRHIQPGEVLLIPLFCEVGDEVYRK